MKRFVRLAVFGTLFALSGCGAPTLVLALRGCHGGGCGNLTAEQKEEQRAFIEKRKELLARRCANDAFENITNPQENIRTVFLITDGIGDRGFIPVLERSRVLKYLGIEYMEFAATQAEQSQTGKALGRISLHEALLTENVRGIEARSAKIAVKIEAIPNAIEEGKYGIRGQLVTVFDLDTGSVFGTLREWGSHADDACPNRPRRDEFDRHTMWTYSSFLSKIINPMTYGCFLSGSGVWPRPRDFLACDSDYWRRTSIRQ